MRHANVACKCMPKQSGTRAHFPNKARNRAARNRARFCAISQRGFIMRSRSDSAENHQQTDLEFGARHQSEHTTIRDHTFLYSRPSSPSSSSASSFSTIMSRCIGAYIDLCMRGQSGSVGMQRQLLLQWSTTTTTTTTTRQRRAHYFI